MTISYHWDPDILSKPLRQPFKCSIWYPLSSPCPLIKDVSKLFFLYKHLSFSQSFCFWPNKQSLEVLLNFCSQLDQHNLLFHLDIATGWQVGIFPIIIDFQLVEDHINPLKKWDAPKVTLFNHPFCLQTVSLFTPMSFKEFAFLTLFVTIISYTKELNCIPTL